MVFGFRFFLFLLLLGCSQLRLSDKPKIPEPEEKPAPIDSALAPGSDSLKSSVPEIKMDVEKVKDKIDSPSTKPSKARPLLTVSEGNCDSLKPGYFQENQAQPFLQCLYLKKGKIAETLEGILAQQMSAEDLNLVAREYGWHLVAGGHLDHAVEMWKLLESAYKSNTHFREQYYSILYLRDSLTHQVRKEVQAVFRGYTSGEDYEKIRLKSLKALNSLGHIGIRRDIKNISASAWDLEKSMVTSTLARLKTHYQQTSDKVSVLGVLDSLESRHQGHPQEFQEFRKWLSEQNSHNLETGDPDTLFNRAEELARRGEYMEARRVFTGLLNSPLRPKARDRLDFIGNLFCVERRKIAANEFKNAQKMEAPSEDQSILRIAISRLDSCLLFFPNLPISEKVKKNQELIQSKLKNLENQSE